MKRLNRYCCPCCPLPLKVGCITFAIAEIAIWMLLFNDHVGEIKKNGGLDKWNEKIELPWAVVQVIVYTMLLYGTIKGKRGYFVPSMIDLVLEIIYLAILCIIDLNKDADADKPADERLPKVYKILFVLPFEIVVVGTLTYFWIVIWSHFQELGEIDQESNQNVGIVYRPEPPTPINNVNV